MIKSGFVSNNHGFHILFDNGYAISVQFGPHNHCNYRPEDNSATSRFVSCTDAEVAVLYCPPDSSDPFDVSFVTGYVLAKMMLNLHHDDEVARNVKPAELALLVSYVSSLKEAIV